MKTKTLIILTLSLVLLIAAAAVLYGLLGDTFRIDPLATVPSETEPSETEPSETAPASQETEGTTEAPDYSAPDFTVTDRDGNSVKLSDFLLVKNLLRRAIAADGIPLDAEDLVGDFLG